MIWLARGLLYSDSRCNDTTNHACTLPAPLSAHVTYENRYFWREIGMAPIGRQDQEIGSDSRQTSTACKMKDCWPLLGWSGEYFCTKTSQPGILKVRPAGNRPSRRGPDESDCGMKTVNCQHRTRTKLTKLMHHWLKRAAKVYCSLSIMNVSAVFSLVFKAAGPDRDSTLT